MKKVKPFEIKKVKELDKQLKENNTEILDSCNKIETIIKENLEIIEEIKNEKEVDVNFLKNMNTLITSDINNTLSNFLTQQTRNIYGKIFLNR
jgi:hypothetical protein